MSQFRFAAAALHRLNFVEVEVHVGADNDLHLTLAGTLVMTAHQWKDLTHTLTHSGEGSNTIMIVEEPHGSHLKGKT